MPDSFDYTPDQLRSMTERQLSDLYYAILNTGPQPGTPLYDLANQVDRLADLAWAKNFSDGTTDYQTGLASLQKMAADADQIIQKLDNAAQILQGINKVIGYIQQGVELAAKVAPLLALGQPGAITASGSNGNRGGYYGWTRDLPDHRDLFFASIRKVKGKLPPSVDLRAGCSPVENQLSLNSCTANALVGALEFLQIKLKESRVDLSRLFLYYNERRTEGTVNQDNGARLRDGIKCLKQFGICSEDAWPYDISKVFIQPPPVCYTSAVSHELIRYYAIRNLDDMKASLAEGFPVAFGFAVFSAFESPLVAKTGILNYPAPSETQLGGHAILAVGYDDKSERLLIRNSWGWDWGQHGYFTMPYAYAFGGPNEPALASDFWTLRQTKS